VRNDSSDRILFLVVAVTLAVSALGFPGYGSLSGSMTNDLHFEPQTNPLALDSTLTVNYSAGGLNFQSISSLEDNSFTDQEFRVDFSLGLLDVDSTLAFDPPEARMDYWLAEGGFTLGRLRVENVFLLEYLEKEESFGAGYELSLSGRLAGGARVYLSNYFGMEENTGEILGIEPGSGYTIVTGDGVGTGSYGPSQLQYVETVLEVTGISFDCCQFHSTTKFSEAEGFEYSLFEFDLEAEIIPLELETELKFSTQTKSVELNPRLDLEWACFDLYTDLSTVDDENLLGNDGTTADTIGGLEIEGFGISEVAVGHLTFSSLTALEGNLFRLSSASDMDLRAEDYVLDPDPVYSGLYTETGYDEVFSIEKSGPAFGLTLGVDFYFDMSQSSSLFDFALLTGSGEYELSDQFTLGAALAVEPDRLQGVRVSLDYYF